MTRKLYHTQEKRSGILSEPILCQDKSAWLGTGYYFWYDLEDAKIWGEIFKRNTGTYAVHKSDVDCENILDTVFNEEHYLFWVESIERAAKELKKYKKPLSIKALNMYFKQKCFWDNVDGIMFQDIPENAIKTKINKLYYKKRIQLAVYNVDIISNFAEIYSKSIR